MFRIIPDTEVELEPEMLFVLRGNFLSLWTDLKLPCDVRGACSFVHDVKFQYNPLCGRRDMGEKLLPFRNKFPFPLYKY
jgi:hypothetical protein